MWPIWRAHFGRPLSQVTTPEQILALGEEGLKRHIKTIGLFNMKAKNVIALSRFLVEKQGGKVPADRLILTDGVLFFRGDGLYRSKIGIAPSRR